MLVHQLADSLWAEIAEVIGGVHFSGPLEVALRACLWSRIASRVLLPLAEFEAADAEALYDGVSAIEWSDHLGSERTIAVSVAGSPSPAGPSHYVALKTKDAIVDRVRRIEGARPNVDKQRPDVRIHVYTDNVRVIVSLDLARRGLHRRGLGRAGAQAPLRENLAAALLRMTGWPARAEGMPLFDPMCGSGTFLVEAAAMALGVAPGTVASRVARARAALRGFLEHVARERGWAKS